MKQKLRYIIFTLLTLHCLLFFAQQKRVVASTSMIADMTKVVAGDRLEVYALVPVGSDPHLFEPVPADAELLAKADLILRNGLTLEGWLDKLIFNSGANASVHTVTTGVDAIMSADYENAYDPHAWMSCRLTKKYVENIYWALSELMPEDKAYFEVNKNEYLKSLDELDVWIKAQLQQIPPEHRVLVTSHDAFRYYANDYGLKVVSVLGTSTDADVSVEDLNKLIQEIEKVNLPAIFIESTINPKLLQQLAHDKGIRIGGKLFADSLGEEDGEAGTYLKMMRHNTTQIVNGLTMSIGVAALKSYEWILLLILIVVFGCSILFIGYLLSPKKGSVSHSSQIRELIVKDMTTSYHKKTVLSNINLKITSGKVYGIIGPNGSGKSTLIKSILGLVDKDYGKVSLDGEAIDTSSGQLAYIPQKEDIDWDFPATVRDVVLTGAYPGKKVFSRINQDDIRKMELALDELGISELIDRQIGELSGGQQQRVFLARALCQNAQLYLLDEPLVGVDVVTEERIIKLLKDLAQQNKIIIMIHHDLSKVDQYFDDVIMINRRLIAFGAVKDVFVSENIDKTYSGQLPLIQKTDNLTG